MSFRDLEAHVRPESALSQAEICVVHEAAGFYVERYASEARGTFILDGQKYGEEAQLITRFNLRNGIFKKPTYGNFRTSCERLTEIAIDEMLELAKNSCYRARFPRLNGLENPEDVPSGIYQVEDFLVMVLRAEKGRFLCSLMLETIAGKPTIDEMVRLATMRAVAITLGKMTPNDRILRQSVRDVLREFKQGGKPVRLQGMSRVELKKQKIVMHLKNTEVQEDLNGLFAQDTTSETVRGWREWRAKPENAGLKYFE